MPIFKPRVGPIHIIAVLARVNLSGDASQDYYADGVTDELITALARHRSLRVISRTSVMQFKGVNQPLRDIAQALGADGILEGSVTRSGNRVHPNLQLINAPTDTSLWADSYDRDLNGAMKLPDELSPTIAAEARVEVAPAKSRRYISPEAHDAYLQGCFYWFMGDDKRAMSYFENVVKLQPDYAAAWDGVGDAAAGGIVDGVCCRRRRSRSTKNTPAKHWLRTILFRKRTTPWRQYIFSNTASTQLNPNFEESHHVLSYILFAQNRDTEALQEQRLSTDSIR